jgi:hypothetical protein
MILLSDDYLGISEISGQPGIRRIKGRGLKKIRGNLARTS